MSYHLNEGKKSLDTVPVRPGWNSVLYCWPVTGVFPNMNLLSRSRNFSIQEFLTSRKSFSIHESPYSGSFTRCLSKFFQKLDPPGPMRNRLKWFCWKIRFRGDIRILSSKDFRFLDFSIFEVLSFFRTHVNSCTNWAPLRRKSQTISLSPGLLFLSLNFEKHLGGKQIPNWIPFEWFDVGFTK